MSNAAFEEFSEIDKIVEGYSEIEYLLRGLLDAGENLEVLSNAQTRLNGPWSVVEIMNEFTKKVRQISQGIDDHPVELGNKCKKTLLEMFAIYMRNFPREFVSREIKTMEDRILTAYINGLRNTELKTNIRLENPKNLPEAVELVKIEYERLNQYYLARAKKSPTNYDCSYCTGHKFHIYDCPLKGPRPFIFCRVTHFS